MNMSLLQIIQLGRKYLGLWPERSELLGLFAEYQQVVISRFVCRYAWQLGLFILILPFAVNAMAFYSQSVISALFVLSMPIQAYIMLGLQADKFLPESLATWYRQGVARINEQGGSIKLSTSKPKYIDLVHLLNISFQQQRD